MFRTLALLQVLFR